MSYQKFDTYIHGLGFVRSKVDHCVYYKEVGEHFIYVVLYQIDVVMSVEVVMEWFCWFCWLKII